MHSQRHTVEATGNELADRFRRDREIGRGAMGVVHEAYDRILDEEVALKSLTEQTPESFRWLKSEFRSVRGINNANLVRLYELFVDKDECFFTMELLEGEDYIQWIERQRDPIAAVIDSLPQLVQGLAALHAAGIRHGDVKPSNIFVTADDRIVYLDFGLASIAGSSNTPGGTWNYMAPEALLGDADVSADWYSLGVVIYESLAGSPPVDGNDPRSLALKQQAEFPSLITQNSHVPTWLSDLVARFLSPAAHDRPPSMELAKQFLGRHPSLSRSTRVDVSATSDHFTGREPEMAVLEDAFDTCSDARKPVVVLVGAKSGMGKTELLNEFTATIEHEGLGTVLRGSAHPREFIPFDLIDDAIEELSELLVNAGFDSTIRPPSNIDLAIKMFPVLETVFESNNKSARTSGALDLQAGCEAVAEILSQLALDSPVILCLEDAHWADPDSATMLRLLLEAIGRAPILVIISYRLGDWATSGFARILDERPLKQIAEKSVEIILGPLEALEAGILTRKRLDAKGLQPWQGLIKSIVTAAEGSPFMIGELVRGLSAADEGKTDFDARTIVADRISEVSQEAKTLLEIVSVAGALVASKVVLEIAGMGAPGQHLLQSMEDDCLLRSHSAQGNSEVGTYHEFVERVVVDDMDGDRIRDTHENLAVTMVATGEFDPATVSHHFFGAEKLPQAGDYALEAGDHASEALAFESAADFYRQAEQWSDHPSDDARSTVLMKLGDALFNAGRTADAAVEFELAARHAANRTECVARTVEAHLVAGEVEEGISRASELLDQHGLTFPEVNFRTRVSIVIKLARLALGRISIPQDSRINDRYAQRADISWFLSKGLIHVRPVEATEFALQSLFAALKSHDPIRIARTMAFIGGGPYRDLPGFRRCADTLLALSDDIAENTNDSYLNAMGLVWRAHADSMNGNWAAIANQVHEGLRILKRACVGSSWEQLIAADMYIHTLHHRGKFRAVRRTADQWLGEMQRLGNLYGQVRFRLRIVYCDLSCGDYASARDGIAWVIDNWTDRPTVAHMFCYLYEVYIELLEGHITTARDKYLTLRTSMRESGAFSSPMARIDLNMCEARVGLCCLASRTDPGDLEKPAELATRITQEQRRDCQAHANLLLAGVRNLEGDSKAVSDLLSDARSSFDTEGLATYSSLVQFVQSAITGDDVDRAYSQKRLKREGIVKPQEWARVFAPGLNTASTDATANTQDTISLRAAALAAKRSLPQQTD